MILRFKEDFMFYVLNTKYRDLIVFKYHKHD